MSDKLWTFCIQYFVAGKLHGYEIVSEIINFWEWNPKLMDLSDSIQDVDEHIKYTSTPELTRDRLNDSMRLQVKWVT